VDLIIAAAPWIRWWFVGPLAVIGAAAFAGYRVQRRRRASAIAEMRSRIAADLHDSLGANLSRIAILSDVLSQQARERMPETASSLDAIGDNARSAIDEMNDAVWLIDPDIRTIAQLLVRVRTVAAQLFDPDTAWTVDAPVSMLEHPLASEERRHLYLLIKEALTNAHRHARPSSVTVRFSMADAGLRVDIEDDGAAVSGAVSSREGNGLGNMRARAEALGGSVTVGRRTPSPGTSVVIQTAIR
jgi:signal transduction histidine kinase